MPKYRDPGADDRMKEFESSLRGVMQEKPKKEKKCDTGMCGTKSLTGKVRDYK